MSIAVQEDDGQGDGIPARYAQHVFFGPTWWKICLSAIILIVGAAILR